jgi:hypothetical protein
VTSRSWRIAAGCLVFAAMARFALLLGPVYYRNLEFHSALELVAARPAASDDELRVAVLQNAARFRLPVSQDQVRVDRRENRLRIDVRYAVPVNLSIYSVDLHFHPAAGK